MAEQIIFSDYQAEVFNEAENLLRTQGYLGEQLFEDTYVLQKRVAEWVISNVPVMGSVGSLMSEATNTYNGVLGIPTDESPAPVVVTPIRSEPILPSPPRTIREFPMGGLPPSFGTTAVRPVRPVKPAIATPVATPPRKIVPRPVPTSLTRPQGSTNPLNIFQNEQNSPYGGFNNIFTGTGMGGGRNTGGGRNGFGGIFGR